LRSGVVTWVVGDEVHDRLGDLAAIGTSTREHGSDVVSHGARPARSGVEDRAALKMAPARITKPGP
jgi:hypothetical protein